MKFRTIDIEGDGLERTLNQKLFPEGNHFDPGTIMWCVTFCDQDYNTLTLVKKLPDTSRLVKELNGKTYYTSAVHYKDTKVPQELNGHVIKEFTEWNEFIKEIIWQIMISDDKVCAKGFGKYNYDAMVLKANLERNGFHDSASQFIKNVTPTVWNNTHGQVKRGEWRPNHIFMRDAIQHNIEDAMQLAQRINNKETKLCPNQELIY